MDGCLRVDLAAAKRRKVFRFRQNGVVNAFRWLLLSARHSEAGRWALLKTSV